MTNILYFKDADEYIDFIFQNMNTLEYPIVTYQEDIDMVEYIERAPSSTPFFIEALEDLTIVTNCDYYEYSIDLTSWYVLENGVTSPNFESGVKIYIRKKDGERTQKGRYIEMSSFCNIGGNATSLVLDEKDFPSKSLYYSPGYVIYFPNFHGSPIIDASKMELPFRSLFPIRCDRMFAQCKYLVSAPELPAREADHSSYLQMFKGCSSLVNIPKSLPLYEAYGTYTQDEGGVYEEMFAECVNITKTPRMNFQAGYSACANMFSGCSSLKDASNITIKGKWIDEYACEKMFLNCTSLEKPPLIKVPEVAEQGCYCMFSGCTSLVNFQHELPATSLDVFAYDSMFSGCSSLIVAPQLPCVNVPEGCYMYMFGNCTALKVVQDVLPATTLDCSVYSEMFLGCTSLVTAPQLPATELVDDCYSNMFENCTSLKNAPEFNIPSVPDKEYIFGEMFKGCSNLDHIKFMAESFEGAPEDCMADWLSGVSATGTFVKSANATWDNEGIVPDGWTVVTE